MKVQLEKVDLRQIDDQTLKQYLAHRNQIRAESLPDDPPVTFAEMRARLDNIPPMVTVHLWLVREVNKPAIIGAGDITVVDTEENQHLGQVSIEVLPAFRQKGLAKKLLGQIVQAAKDENRQLIIMGTEGNVPAGEHFMRRIGAQKGLEAHTNQLKLEELEQSLIQDWIRRSTEKSGEAFELGLWDGPYPQEELPAIVALHEVMNQQPMGDLDVEDFHWTEDHLRQIEQMLFSGGRERWTYYAREKATGEFAGYTEVLWNPNQPHLLQQGDTAVYPHFRNRGLGRWLKAAMLEKVLKIDQQSS